MSEEPKSSDVAQLEADIESTRQDLAETVDLLAAKFDVKARLGGQITQARDAARSRLRIVGDRTRQKGSRTQTQQLSVAAGVVAATFAVVVVALWRRNRASRRRGWRP